MKAKRSGRTSPSIHDKPVPRLPHERDESSDSQISEEVQPIIQQAHDDVMAGRVDTDRGVPMEKAYQRQKEPAAPIPRKSKRA
ncbi:MAG: hypothetical protein H7Z15_20815 [Rhizobacter sp.]|nr:hypothetical protein [Rhizobacter sp.]